MLVTLGMAPDCQQQLLLGISELMTNVVRHAKPSAHRMHLVLCRQHKVIWLQLEDDGGAFDSIRHALLADRTWHQGARLRVSDMGLNSKSVAVMMRKRLGHGRCSNNSSFWHIIVAENATASAGRATRGGRACPRPRGGRKTEAGNFQERRHERSGSR